MNILFTNFTNEYEIYNISANAAKFSIYNFNQNYPFPNSNVNQLCDQNIIIGPYVSRITIRKQKLTNVVNKNIDVKNL